MKGTAVALVAVVLGAFAALPTSTVSAQDAQALATQCDAQAGGDPTMCALAVGGGRDLMGDVGTLAGPGSEIPGQPSTLGRRLGGTPRFAPSLRVGAHSVVVPDLADPTGAGEGSHLVPALHAGLGLGVFDGFSLLPTVGGFLSIDVVGQASFLFFSESDGFDGRVDVLSVSARVGLLRESFTLPGVTVSVSRRLSGSLRLGDTAAGDAGEVALDPSVTSLRATVGKDLFAFGVLAGVGWDDYSSETAVRVTDGAAGFVAVSETLEASRASYFVGLSKQLGVLSWISAEVGWARGFTPVTIGSASSPDRGTTVFGSLAILFKL
jgi:hypothetical protein